MEEKIIILIDGGDTYNFINDNLSTTKKMKTDPFLDFDLIVRNGNITSWKMYVTKMKVSFKDYTI